MSTTNGTFPFVTDEFDQPVDELTQRGLVNDVFLRGVLKRECVNLNDIIMVAPTSTYKERNHIGMNLFYNYLYDTNKYFKGTLYDELSNAARDEFINKHIMDKFYNKRRLIKVEPPRHIHVDNPYIEITKNPDFINEERYFTSVAELYRQYAGIAKKDTYQFINMSKYYLLLLDGWGEYELIHPEFSMSSEQENNLVNILFAVRTVQNGSKLILPSLCNEIAVPVFDRMSGSHCQDPPIFSNNTIAINLDTVKDRLKNRIAYIPQLNMSIYVIGTHSDYKRIGIREHIFQQMKDSHPCFTDYKRVYTSRIEKMRQEQPFCLDGSPFSIAVNCRDNKHATYFIAMMGTVVSIPVTHDPDNLTCISITSTYLDAVNKNIVPMTIYRSENPEEVFRPVHVVEVKSSPEVIGTDYWIMGTDYSKVLEEYTKHRMKIRLSQYTEEAIENKIKEATKHLTEKIKTLKMELETKKAEYSKLEFEYQCLKEKIDMNYYKYKKDMEIKSAENEKFISELKLAGAFLTFLVTLLAVTKRKEQKDKILFRLQNYLPRVTILDLLIKRLL